MTTVHDLGCGTGSMLQWSAPRLPGPQHWVLVDRDADLLEHAATTAPATASDGSAVQPVETHAAHDITRLGFQAGPRRRLVDHRVGLVGHARRGRARSIRQLVRRARMPVLVRRSRSPAGSTSTQRIRWTRPSGRRSTATSAARAGGVDCSARTPWRAAADRFARRGYQVRLRPSDWRLAAGDAALTAEWLDGWVAAACEQRPDLAAAAERYRSRRLSGGRGGPAGRDRAAPGSPGPTTMIRQLWRWGRVLAGAAVLGMLVWRWGTGPFVAGLRLVDGWSLAAAAGIAALTTMCCAWRWRLVSHGLGVELSFPSAVAACYRSQFLNTALPGGVLGDVHRGVRHGGAVGDVGRGLRSVGWERAAGQAVQIVVAIVVLSILPSPVRAWTPLLGIIAAVAIVVALVAARSGRGVGQSRWARTCEAAAADVRYGLLARASWPGIVVASVVVVGRSYGDVPHRRADRGCARLAGSAAATRAARPARDERPDEHRWLGPARGRRGMGVRRGGTRGYARSVHGGRHGVIALVATLPGAFVLVVASRRRSAADAVRSSRPEPPLVDTSPAPVGAASVLIGRTPC